MLKIKNFLLASCLTLSIFSIKNIFCYEDFSDEKLNNVFQNEDFCPVKKYVLENGLTLLIKKTDLLQDVECLLGINVGSKDEKDGTRGYSHIIEHMLFRGTEKLSETDI